MSRKNRHYHYADARCQISGSMQCCVCGKKIIEGCYRYFETADAYISCHRSCCSEDPKWLEIDQQEQRSIEQRRLFEADVLAFYDKWGGLDDDDFMSIVINRPAIT